MPQFYDGYVNYYSGMDDSVYQMSLNAWRASSHAEMQFDIIKDLLAETSCRDIHDFSLSPPLAPIAVPAGSRYIKYVTDARQARLVKTWYPAVEIEFIPEPFYTPALQRASGLIIALNSLPYVTGQMEILEQILTLEHDVLIDIVTSGNKDIPWCGPRGHGVLRENLWEIATEYNVVPYEYYIEQVKGPVWWIYWTMVRRFELQQILVGAEKSWDSEDIVTGLSAYFSKCIPELRSELDHIYGTLDQKSVLDLGCGPGRLPSIYNMKEYTGVDQSEMMLDQAKKLHPLLRFLRSSIESYQDSGHYDVVMLIDVLQHVEMPRVLINDILARFRADIYIFRAICNHTDTRHYHRSKRGTTSISYPISFWYNIANDLEKIRYDAKVIPCHPLPNEKSTFGVYIIVGKGN